MKTKNVKRIIAIALFVGLFSAFSVHAASPAAVTAKNIRQKFGEVFQNVNDRQNVPVRGIVVVIFSINEDGRLEIRKLESTDEEAANFVREKLSTIASREFSYPSNHLYRVRFSFEPV
jgi:hypothetical protein